MMALSVVIPVQPDKQRRLCFTGLLHGFGNLSVSKRVGLHPSVTGQTTPYGRQPEVSGFEQVLGLFWSILPKYHCSYGGVIESFVQTGFFRDLYGAVHVPWLSVCSGSFFRFIVLLCSTSMYDEIHTATMLQFSDGITIKSDGHFFEWYLRHFNASIPAGCTSR